VPAPAPVRVRARAPVLDLGGREATATEREGNAPGAVAGE